MDDSTWPYPAFCESAWLRGDGKDPALLAVRAAVHSTLSAREQPVDDSHESILAGLTALADLGERIDWALLALVGEGRSRSLTWSALGEALGLSKQAVQQRFGPWVAQALSQQDAVTLPQEDGEPR